ncbi:MAG: hypothetical protein WC465_04610 [Patescibacteria group bacterium]
MSLILGINLTDRIILATDSKVTKSVNGKREVVGYCTKLVQYNDRVLNEDKVVKNRKDLGNFISCMYAGNKDFSFFIHQKLSVAFEKGVLSTDINVLQTQIDDFFKKITPEYDGVKKCLMIFAGVSLSGSIKIFSFKRLSDLIGPQAGHVEDPNIVGALQFASQDSDTTPLMNRENNYFVPDQKLFSFEIDEDRHKFGIGKIGGTYSVVAGGSTTIDENLENKILKYFLTKRDIKAEASDIINFIRSNFSDSIGGAVVLGYIDTRGILTNVSYQVDRSGEINDKNWSIEINGKDFIALDPESKRIDLLEYFFNGSGDSDCLL